MTGWLDPSADTIPWSEIGPASDILIPTLSKLFWEGLTREIAHAVLSQKRLEEQKPLPEEEAIMNRLPESVFHFIEAWERQRPNVAFRRSRMLLQGLTILDIDRLVQFREPLLISQIGKAQINIARVPQMSGGFKTILRSLVCCECQRTIRTSFFECRNVCIHHIEDKGSRCNWAKHQYVTCGQCYASSEHTKQHLKKTRPYDPLELDFDPPISEEELPTLTSQIKRLQKQEDEREDSDRGLLRTAMRVSPESLKRRLLPYGNVHTSVTFGPLIFEIGVRDSKKGVLISLRNPPDLAQTEDWKLVETEKTTPTIAVSPGRQVFTGVRRLSMRVTQASLKQVLGGVFSGHQGDWLEVEVGIVNSFTAESTTFEERPSFNRRQLRRCAESIVEGLKSLIYEEVQLYLKHFALRILDTKVDLTWNQHSNNCQTFCNNILMGRTFDTVLPKDKPLATPTSRAPRYLLSFASENFGSLFDTSQYKTVPSAVYFQEFHTDEDLIEYFDTWTTMPLQNRCSKLFCWPCLNEDTCSLCEHMWLMPHETISILQLHLIRGRSCYKEAFKTDDPREEAQLMTDESWMSNRLQILLALDSFLGAAGGLSGSYQHGIDLLVEEGKSRTWMPQPAKKIRLIQPPSKEGEYNFTIKDSGWTLPFSKNEKMKQWFEKTTVKKGEMKGKEVKEIPLR